ncbi:CvfB family protein [Clostridium tarantellae]|uniref:DNA-binding protein n=1 Tax=Clostridium tarantellae TaxID=39493 RepID=A0A6I1MVR1_9CLOT|nr:S1-like domain-containing RNA-binding protein [Clostridium tarantellae]MPQ44921.1 DNA-binding protein [Clostridium tarantellae]
MIRIGEINNLKVVRKAEFGVYVDRGTGKTSDDILIPTGSLNGREVSIGDELEVFIYRDSRDRLIGTLKEPMAKVGDVAFLEVTSITKIGAFVNFGLERDLLVPLREQKYKMEEGKKYLVYIYVDKTGRLAATTDIDKYLLEIEEPNLGDEVSGIVYGYQTNGSLRVAIDNIYRGVVLKNEYFKNINPGDEIKGKIKRIYDDGIVGLSIRNSKLQERDELSEKIISYLNEHGGVMPYNDKTSPEIIRKKFNTSKNYFKIALGGLMKKELIEQDEFGTRLK